MRSNRVDWLTGSVVISLLLVSLSYCGLVSFVRHRAWQLVASKSPLVQFRSRRNKVPFSVRDRICHATVVGSNGLLKLT